MPDRSMPQAAATKLPISRWELKHLGVAIDGGEQVLHVGRPPRQLAPAAGAAAHLIH